jgi:hypothetical protein
MKIPQVPALPGMTPLGFVPKCPLCGEAISSGTVVHLIEAHTEEMRARVANPADPLVASLPPTNWKALLAFWGAK